CKGADRPPSRVAGRVASVISPTTAEGRHNLAKTQARAGVPRPRSSSIYEQARRNGFRRPAALDDERHFVSRDVAGRGGGPTACLRRQAVRLSPTTRRNTRVKCA